MQSFFIARVKPSATLTWFAKRLRMKQTVSLVPIRESPTYPLTFVSTHLMVSAFFYSINSLHHIKFFFQKNNR